MSVLFCIVGCHLVIHAINNPPFVWCACLTLRLTCSLLTTELPWLRALSIPRTWLCHHHGGGNDDNNDNNKSTAFVHYLVGFIDDDNESTAFVHYSVGFIDDDDESTASCITSLASSTTTTRVRHSCITRLASSSSFHYGYAMMPGLLFTHLLDQSNSHPMHTRLPTTTTATDVVDLTMSCSKLVVQARQSQRRLYWITCSQVQVKSS